MKILFDSAIALLLSFVNSIGYFGVFLGMFLESTIIPIPSELIMIPAGIAVANGTMDFYVVTFVGIAGNIFGAIFSYYVSAAIGRPLLLRYGKFFFVKEKTLNKVDNFFAKHGSISVFISRLLPGFRHFISIPAGIAKMNKRTFFIYTTIGSTIWTTILSLIGFFVGKNQQLIGDNLYKIATYAAIITCLAIITTYFLALVIRRKSAKRS